MTRTIAPALAALALGACTPVDVGPAEAGTDAGGENLCTAEHFDVCDGICTNLDITAEHCGECGHACPSGATCILGICLCPETTTDCGDVCADPLTSSQHCGGCGNACPENHRCVSGQCEESCPQNLSRCDGECFDLTSSIEHCGGCGQECTGRRACLSGICRCLPGQTSCLGICADLQSDEEYCGACENSQCSTGYECQAGTCICPAGKSVCFGSCIDTQQDPNNCGGCNLFCQPGQVCFAGQCQTLCPSGWLQCNGDCVNPETDPLNCGSCGNACTGGDSCLASACQPCNSAAQDCDSDGWTVAEGDCCDQPGLNCGAVPALVNPGAFEVLANLRDDNCNGLLDATDVDDTRPCDASIDSDTTNAFDFAKAIGLCRTTQENPQTKQQRTWGVIDARLLLADGTTNVSATGHSVRTTFGKSVVPVEGESFAVIASGAAADATQTDPGPNGGPVNTSIQHSTQVSIQSCTSAYCINDWFKTANPPLKDANRLPEAPGCFGSATVGGTANDSVMLYLRLRAPTNARAFEFRGYFLSSEYPEYVCTQYNDQLVALIDTPNGAPIGYVNTRDKNLMTYFDSGNHWPIGINVARGTDLFKVCEDAATNFVCWDQDVSTTSCSAGAAALDGTGFEHTSGPGSCLNGGATGWLITSGNVRPGDIVELRVAIWDVGDHILDSLAILDAFRWLQTPVTPGTAD